MSDYTGTYFRALDALPTFSKGILQKYTRVFTTQHMFYRLHSTGYTGLLEVQLIVLCRNTYTASSISNSTKKYFINMRSRAVD